MIDKALTLLYTPYLSTMDIFAITLLSILGGWYLLLAVPWIFWSQHQQIKYGNK